MPNREFKVEATKIINEFKLEKVFVPDGFEKVTISKGEFPIRSISINNNFIAALNQKLLWGEDKRNLQ